MRQMEERTRASSQLRTTNPDRQRSVRVQIFTIMLVTLFACLDGVHAGAQVTGLGVVLGTVADPSGAAVVNAKITIANVATNVTQTSVTNSTGYFEVDSLNPGVYRISVAASGFENLVRQGITLLADAHIKVPLQLSVGHATQSVVVTADAALINTENGSNGQVLTTKQLELLPAAGANPMQFAEMAPGIQSPYSQTFSMEDTLSWNGVSKFGALGFLDANEYSLDGAPNEGNPRGNAVDLSQDEVAEMKVEAVAFDASVGHTMGATVTQTTKSGTNDLHGVVDELYQDKSWSAMQHFQGLNYRYQQTLNGCTGANASSPQCLQVKYQYGLPGTHMNLYAGTLGGPVFIPKLYDGRNRFFFFVAVDGDSWIDDSVVNDTIPTVQERGGDFSDLPETTSGIPAAYVSACGSGTPYYGQYQIYNPFSVTLDSKGVPRRAPFCGNKIPAGLMSTTSGLSSFYNALLPATSQSNPIGINYVYTNSNLQAFKQFTQRMDYAISENNHVNFRWTRFHYSNRMRGFTIGDVDQNNGDRWADIGSFGWNHVFSARTNLTVTGGASQYKTIPNVYPGYEKYSPSSVGLPNYLDTYDGATPSLPVFSLGGYTTIGATQTSAQYYRTLAFGGAFTHVQGSHTIQVGAEWRLQNYAHPQQANTNGTYSFDATYTQENNGTDNTYPRQNAGLSYAAFLLGIPTTSSVAQGSPISINTPYYALYVTDTWRITRKLTISAGARYEFEFGPAEKHNEQIVGWDANASLPISAGANAAYSATISNANAAQQAVLPSSLVIQGGPIYAGVNGASLRQFVNDYRIMPRLAFSYAFTPQTVLRVGYGIFFDTINAHGAGISPFGGIGVDNAWPGAQFSTVQDGFSASTSVASSTTYGTNFSAGSTPLSDPFPAVNGSRFNSAVGNVAGAMYYAGSGTTAYDHGIVPPRAERIYVGVQHQFGSSTMVEAAYLGSFMSKILITDPVSHVPGSFYTGGTQPNVAGNALLSSLVSNPFAIGNFSGLASSNPAAYGLIAHNSYFTSSTISVANLVRNYPQMSGLSLYEPFAESHFQEAQLNLTRRYSQGLTVMGALQMNDQHDRNYYANAFDTSLSWEPSNNSSPYRLTAEGLYQFPFGRGERWINSGWGARLLGGFQLGASYELHPGWLLTFGNLFYLGTPGKDIKLKHPVYVNNQTSGGYNYVQWLNPGNVTTTYSNGTCTYSGIGFVTNSQCQPNGYNLRVLPPRINGVRDQSTDTLQANIQRTFPLGERFSLETRIAAFNILNRQVLADPNTSPTSSLFGQITADGGVNQSGNARWLNIQGRLRF